MPSRVRVDLFCEDRGHEQIVLALLARLGRELGLEVRIETRSSRGGHGRALTEFRAWQRWAAQTMGAAHPDLVVLVIDANCQGWNPARSVLEKAIDTSVFPRWVIGCPDPHVERWCLADPTAFCQIVGGPPPSDPDKCERGRYKDLLANSCRANDFPILTDVMEIAPDLIEVMDLDRAGKNQKSLGHFIRDLRSNLRQAAIPT